MLYSKLFGKTLKTTSKKAEAISHQYLVRGGFIDQLSAGIYSFLPLGWRVHQKIENIIREEMNVIDGQELFLPTLQPKSLWLETDRWEKMDPPLFVLKDQHQREYALGSTHEEVITDLVRRYINSYKDLPLYLYQIQNKFRNEIRATSGLLRVREFIMKDLYSFHTSEKDLDDYYQKVLAAYKKIFTRCGFVVKVTEATSGTIGGDVSHEFMMFCETGEDKILFCPKCDFGTSKEVLKKCPKCDSLLEEGRAIENGHIFKLGTKYSKSMNACFVDEKGKKQLIWMGCYGIGVGRLMGTVIEAHHDEKGIIWPENIAPFKAHLICLGEKETKTANDVYQKLKERGIEVLYDDRKDVSVGVKFTDADLIGVPYRLVISPKTGSKIEFKKRDSQETQNLDLNDLIKELQ